jgi:hypothetical protein
MISLTMDMVQYDCPYVAASADYEVGLSGMHWEFDTAAGELETRRPTARNSTRSSRCSGTTTPSTGTDCSPGRARRP